MYAYAVMYSVQSAAGVVGLCVMCFGLSVRHARSIWKHPSIKYYVVLQYSILYIIGLLEMYFNVAEFDPVPSKDIVTEPKLLIQIS